MNDPIKIWWYREAPEELKMLSEHGGDEDWIIIAPLHLQDDAEMIADKLAISDWNKAQTLFDEVEVVVYITAHA